MMKMMVRMMMTRMMILNQLILSGTMLNDGYNNEKLVSSEGLKKFHEGEPEQLCQHRDQGGLGGFRRGLKEKCRPTVPGCQ